MNESDRQGQAIGVMLLAMLVFSLNDVLGKWLVASYSVSLLMAMRSLAALTVLLVLLRPNAWGDRVNQLWQVEHPWLRAFVLVVEGMGFYAAVALLPLADVVTYWLAAPIYVAALSPWLLGERVDGWGRADHPGRADPFYPARSEMTVRVAARR